MRKIAHDTVGVRKHAVAAEDFWEFRPGDAVLADGFPGRVAEVLDGPVPGNESYMVTLDNGAGGGEYTAAQLSRPGGVTASLISVESPQDVLEPVEATSMMLASHWYPELGSILTDRLPNERLTFEAGLQHTSSLTPHLWSFQPGDRVLADGIPGYILTQVNPAISQAAGAGQLYRVVLANGLGEGEFFQAQLQHTAKKEWQLGEVAGEAICGGCEQYHPAWYHHEGQFGEGPIFETSCPKDGLSDFHTAEGLRKPKKAAVEGPVYYHGSRWTHKPGDILTGGHARGNQGYGQPGEHVYYTTRHDVASAFAEAGYGPPGHEEANPKVYAVEPIEGHEDDPDEEPEAQSYRARKVRVLGRVRYDDDAARRFWTQGSVEDATKESWDPGETAHYEYHCLESPESSDADLWYRSHQPVTVLHRNEGEPDAESMTKEERGEEGIPFTYRVRFPDGHEGDAWEDELMTHPRHWYRPDPPTMPHQGSVEDPSAEDFGAEYRSDAQPDVCSWCGNPGPWGDVQDTGRGTRMRCRTCGGTMRLNPEGIQWQPEFPNSPQNAASGAGDPRATINTLDAVRGSLQSDFADQVMARYDMWNAHPEWAANPRINAVATQEAGYPIFHEPQLKQAVLNTLQRAASVVDSDFRFQMTATWADVRAKAKRIRDEDGVRITAASTAGAVGEVRGDTATYESEIVYVPGTRKIGYWHCGCKWAGYAWGRSPAYKRFEGRPCSHNLALRFTVQSRGMFGREVTPDGYRMDGQHPHSPVQVQYQRPDQNFPEGRDIRRRTVPPGNMRTEWHPNSRVRVKGSLSMTPVHEWARLLIGLGTAPSQVINTLHDLTVPHALAREAVRWATSSMDSTAIEIGGLVRHAVAVEGNQIYTAEGELVDAHEASLHVAKPWLDFGETGVPAEVAKPRSVRRAGFKGYVAGSDWEDEAEPEERDRDFDEDLWDRVAPHPTHEERQHFELHDEYPDEYYDRHGEAYNRAAAERDARNKIDDTPDHIDDHLAHFVREHGSESDLWRRRGTFGDVDLSKGVYATQSHVGQFHIDRHLNGADRSWHQEIHGLRPTGDEFTYLGDEHPMFVTHEGRLHATEGHHRTAAALQRGEKSIKGWHYDLDKYPVAENPFGDRCEDCEDHVAAQNHTVHASRLFTADRDVTADPDGAQSIDPTAGIPGFADRDQTERKKKHLLHHTNDAREHAHNFGYGMPWGAQMAWCDQCNGSGCGHCGGTGQVVVGDGLAQDPSDASTTESGVSDQSVDAGTMIGDSGSGMNATGALAAIDQASCPHDQGFNLHGQCKRCGYTPPTEADEPCDEPWCVANEPEHSKGEHIDPPHLDPYHPDYQSAEHNIDEAFGHHPDSAWLLDQNHTGPTHLSSRQFIQPGEEGTCRTCGQTPREGDAPISPVTGRCARCDTLANEEDPLHRDPYGGSTSAWYHPDQQFPGEQHFPLHDSWRDRWDERLQSVNSLQHTAEVIRKVHIGLPGMPMGTVLCGATPTADRDDTAFPPREVSCEDCRQLAPEGVALEGRGMYHMALVRTADYTSTDFSGGMADQQTKPATPTSNSPNPASTGFATSSDPNNWTNPIVNDGFNASWEASLKMTASGDTSKPPVAAGVALKAADTGRVLMIQRSNKDEKDPARGTWEFPGGHREDGDQTSLHAAIREFEEEVGQAFPVGGHLTHVHRAGPYVLHTVVVPEESAIDFSNGRATVNPDDPDGDDHEQSAWWDPEHARKNPALRPECKSNPWGEIKKAASFLTVEDARAAARAAGIYTEEQAREALREGPSLQHDLDLFFHGTLHDEPEGALPSTDGASEDGDQLEENDEGATDLAAPEEAVPGLDIDRTVPWGYPESAAEHPNPAVAQPGSADVNMDPSADSSEDWLPLRQQAAVSPEMQLAAQTNPIIAQFQQTAGFRAMMSDSGPAQQDAGVAAGGPPSDGDIAAAAREMLTKIAAKNFSFAEQQELIGEGGGLTRARNFGKLRIEGTHYERLGDDEASDDEWLLL